MQCDGVRYACVQVCRRWPDRGARAHYRGHARDGLRLAAVTERATAMSRAREEEGEGLPEGGEAHLEATEGGEADGDLTERKKTAADVERK